MRIAYKSCQAITVGGSCLLGAEDIVVDTRTVIDWRHALGVDSHYRATWHGGIVYFFPPITMGP